MEAQLTPAANSSIVPFSEPVPSQTTFMDAPSPPPRSQSASPPPCVSPTLALGALPHLDRSVSTASSISSALSSRSSVSGRSDDAKDRRRGYMRPQATVFADSARNRESVMSLGSIAHLQYYFARTGLLDGKGGQLAKGDVKIRKSSGGSMTADGGRKVSSGSYGSTGEDYSLLSSGAADASFDDGMSAGLVESPVDADGEENWDQEPMMLPPTVSTYNEKILYVPPLPDLIVLRRELREGLEDARNALMEAERGNELHAANKENVKPEVDDKEDTTSDGTESQGWYEIQGLHLLDLVTLAIRAARNYYTAHEDPQRLYSIKSERLIRGELYNVMDILKRMAIRKFAGGIRKSERESIMAWTIGIDQLLETEEKQEKAEQEERDKWSWTEGNWAGREREREWLFLKSFDPDPDNLPEWDEPVDEELPTMFLTSMQSGLRLVRLHNALLKKSKRQFEEIKVFHTDTLKPYRCAENLRFWAKAAELRWDIKLDFDALAVVQGKDQATWQKFDSAILKWCVGVRQELMNEWKEQKTAQQTRPPTLRVDTEELE